MHVLLGIDYSPDYTNKNIFDSYVMEPKAYKSVVVIDNLDKVVNLTIGAQKNLIYPRKDIIDQPIQISFPTLRSPCY